MNSEEYIAHYGVLGMKWGIRRARKASKKAAKYRSKGKISKANEYSAKSKKIQSRHERLGGKSTYKRVQNISTGKALVESMIFGTYGAVKYNKARSEGYGRGKAIVDGIATDAANRFTYGLYSIVDPRIKKKSKMKF